jgi:colanic acid biosynthesis glycosyl transferase WcaI
VLIVGLNYAPEPIGIGPFTTGLAEFLAGGGHAVSVIAGWPYYPQWRRYAGYGGLTARRSLENGVCVTRCPHYVPRVPSGLRRILHHVSFACTALPAAVAAALRDRPQAVVCITPSILSVVVARVAARLARSPLWLHVQDLEVDAAIATGLIAPGRLARLLLAGERALLRSANRVSSIGQAMIDRLVEKGVRRDATYELRNWATVPAASGDAFRREWQLEGRTVALYSGSIGRKQGAEVIVAAARRLAARDDIVFVVCGDGPELERLKAQGRGLANLRFHPLQPVERLAELLALADMHLLPQVTAAADLVLPSKLANMLASGCPVVATAEPGTALAAEVSGCGIVIAPCDATTLADAVVALADDPQRAAALGTAGAARAAERWSAEAILRGFERELLALASAARAA